MKYVCEVCANPVTGAPRLTMIEGSLLQVCNSCSQLGTTFVERRLPERRVLSPNPGSSRRKLLEPEFELLIDFHKVIREAREKMGLSQEQLGLRIAEKTSVIKLLESGRLKPNIILARKLERFLKIQLFAPAESLE